MRTTINVNFGTRDAFEESKVKRNHGQFASGGGGGSGGEMTIAKAHAAGVEHAKSGPLGPEGKKRFAQAHAEFQKKHGTVHANAFKAGASSEYEGASRAARAKPKK